MFKTPIALLWCRQKNLNLTKKLHVITSFQNRVNLTEAEVKLETMAEFKTMVASLRKEGVQVVEFDYPELGVETPDAVFPNNWFSTCGDGSLFTFPMACENRQHEVKPHALIEALEASGRIVNHSESMESYVAQGSLFREHWCDGYRSYQ